MLDQKRVLVIDDDLVSGCCSRNCWRTPDTLLAKVAELLAAG